MDCTTCKKADRCPYIRKIMENQRFIREYYLKTHPLVLKERIIDPLRKILNRMFGRYFKRYELRNKPDSYLNSILLNKNFEGIRNSIKLYLNNKFRKYKKAKA